MLLWQTSDCRDEGKKAARGKGPLEDNKHFKGSLRDTEHDICPKTQGDHFLSYMPRWLLEFLAPRKLEGKKKSNIYRMPRLIS
ncbi:hypothetical protein NQZ68_016183 [Dissostichus eleginoides]|nr:hypothetical protein NQZ68_016183 [Dissostichus eleginoides]